MRARPDAFEIAFFSLENGSFVSSVLVSMRARVARLPKQKIVHAFEPQRSAGGHTAFIPCQPSASLSADARHKDAPVGVGCGSTLKRMILKNQPRIGTIVRGRFFMICWCGTIRLPLDGLYPMVSFLWQIRLALLWNNRRSLPPDYSVYDARHC